MNYEISDTMGYRRCDGYESYDGFTDGGTTNFYVMQVNGVVGAAGMYIVGAEVEDPSKLIGNKTLGIVVNIDAVAGPLYTITFATYNKLNRFPVGYSLSIGGGAVTVTVAPVPLANSYTPATATTYYSTLRTYMAFLRARVTKSISAIAGLHYSGSQLYKAVDNAGFTTTGNFNVIAVGQTFQFGTFIYRKMATYKTSSTYMEATIVGTRGPSLPTIQPLDMTSSAVGGTIAVTGLNAIPPTSAHIVFANNPYADNYMFGIIGDARGDVELSPSYQVGFNDGQNTTVAPIAGTAGLLYSSGGSIKGSITIDSSYVTSGSWAGSNATGTGQFHFDQFDTAVYPVVGDTVRTAAGVILYTIDSVTIAYIPGTGALKANNCYYQWGTFNFFATTGFSGTGGSGGNIWGATGCSRGFWVSRSGWGNIYTQTDSALDVPKYVSMHCRAQLAFGFARGTVQLSVVGEPMNFSGVDGAQEAGMGDTITGLLESQGTSTIVLCRASIARLSGVGASLQQETISGKIGAFDYTGSNVGSTPVFTNQNGISTLEQSAAYGDFVGEKGTSSVSTKLIPKLVDDASTFEIGGVVCAFPCRAKDQYRLVIKDGTVYSLAFTSEGPKPMINNWAARFDTTKIAYVPMAWSSEVDIFGREQLHIAFDLTAARAYAGETSNADFPDPRVTYRLDYGWGHDGKVFASYFDIASIFTGGGVTNGSVEEVRMYGMGYGLATLDVKTSSVETNFDQPYHTVVQDISMPITPVLPYKELSPVTSIVDQASWGLGTKVRINGSNATNSDLIEPPHSCQVIQLHAFTQGALDS